jgi:hypothetical protein
MPVHSLPHVILLAPGKAIVFRGATCELTRKRYAIASNGWNDF